MSSITLLQPAQSNRSSAIEEKSVDNHGVEKNSSRVKFGDVLSQAEGDVQAKSGKYLPKEEKMPRSQGSLQSSADSEKGLVQPLTVREAGQINLIGVVEGLDDQSSIEGGQLGDQELVQSKPSSIVMMDVEWLKLRGQVTSKEAITDSGNIVNEVKPANLAEAMAAQLLEPRNPTKSSKIIEIIAVKDLSQLVKAQVSPETSEQSAIKFSDLLPALTRKQGGGPSTNQGGSSDSGSFASNQFDTKSLGELAKSSGPQEFREFLAEHLKRAESLRDLTDKLGNMIARQMAGQIGRGRWSLEMAMHPAELGSIEIEMEMTERGLEASFRASHSVTRDLLMESMPRLKAWFEEGGIDVAYAGLEQDSGAQNGGNSTGEQQAQSEIQTAESEESPELTDNQWFQDGSYGLDIRV